MAIPTINNFQRTAATSASYTPTNIANAVLVVGVGQEDSNGDSDITNITYDGNNLTKRADAKTGTTQQPESNIWTLTDPRSFATTGTIAVTGGEAGDINIWALTLGGVDQTTPVDDTDTPTGNTNSLTGNLTTTVADCLLIGLPVHRDTNALSPGTGVTELGEAGADAPFHNQAMGHKDAASSGAQTFNYTSGATNDFSMAVVAFRPPGGGAATAGVQSKWLNCTDGFERTTGGVYVRRRRVWF